MIVAFVLITAALVIVIALLAGAGAAKLARLDGATYPAALTRGAAAFAATVTLAAVVTGALAALLLFCLAPSGAGSLAGQGITKITSARPVPRSSGLPLANTAQAEYTTVTSLFGPA
ncbi:hypothetical protein AB0D56_26980 [Streptomyces sp. NPDC048209]|uniref:hypothetical protein n=1 Tax=Streptomyces sp. NPDC048209 TaxID=3156689 RepID=UPI003429F17A